MTDTDTDAISREYELVAELSERLTGALHDLRSAIIGSSHPPTDRQLTASRVTLVAVLAAMEAALGGLPPAGAGGEAISLPRAWSQWIEALEVGPRIDVGLVQGLRERITAWRDVSADDVALVTRLIDAADAEGAHLLRLLRDHE